VWLPYVATKLLFYLFCLDRDDWLLMTWKLSSFCVDMVPYSQNQAKWPLHLISRTLLQNLQTLRCLNFDHKQTNNKPREWSSLFLCFKYPTSSDGIWGSKVIQGAVKGPKKMKIMRQMPTSMPEHAARKFGLSNARHIDFAHRAKLGHFGDDFP